MGGGCESSLGAWGAGRMADRTRSGAGMVADAPPLAMIPVWRAPAPGWVPVAGRGTVAGVRSTLMARRRRLRPVDLRATVPRRCTSMGLR